MDSSEKKINECTHTLYAYKNVNNKSISIYKDNNQKIRFQDNSGDNEEEKKNQFSSTKEKCIKIISLYQSRNQN